MNGYKVGEMRKLWGICVLLLGAWRAQAIVVVKEWTFEDGLPKYWSAGTLADKGAADSQKSVKAAKLTNQQWFSYLIAISVDQELHCRLQEDTYLSFYIWTAKPLQRYKFQFGNDDVARAYPLVFQPGSPNAPDFSETGKWVPVSIKMRDFKHGLPRSTNPPPDWKIGCGIRDCFFLFGFPGEEHEIYLDNLRFTNQGAPGNLEAEIRAHKQIKEKEKQEQDRLLAEMTRTPAQDGFSLTPGMCVLLREAYQKNKDRVVPRTILICGSSVASDMRFVSPLMQEKLKEAQLLPQLLAADSTVLLGGQRARKRLQAALEKKPEVVIFMFDISDFFKGLLSKDLIAPYQELVKTAKETGATVVLCTPPVPNISGYTPLTPQQSAEITAFNHAVVNLGTEENVPVIAAYEMLNVSEAQEARKLFGGQGVNTKPSTAGYDKINAALLLCYQMLEKHVFQRAGDKSGPGSGPAKPPDDDDDEVIIGEEKLPKKDKTDKKKAPDADGEEILIK